MYVLNSRRNLISVSKLVNKGFTVNFANEAVIKGNNLFKCSGIETNGLYVITLIAFDKHDMELNNSEVLYHLKERNLLLIQQGLAYEARSY